MVEHHPTAKIRDSKTLTGFSKFIDDNFYILALLLIPVSLAYDVFEFILTRITYVLAMNSPICLGNHELRVSRVQKQVTEWIKGGKGKQMCTSRPSWKSITLENLTYKNRLYLIDVDLPHILQFDEEKMVVRVEPNVSVGNLNGWLIDRGFTLKVVPELDDLTIGGLVMGGGIECTSHKYGLFHITCVRYEMVMCDASIKICSEDENQELFCAIPFSYGTLGFLTAVDIEVMKYKPFIRMEYIPIKDGGMDEICKEFANATSDPTVESLEGILFSESDGVVMRGRFVDAPNNNDDALINPIGRWYSQWFYLHVKSFLNKEEKSIFVEYIPTVDYYHRHNKSFFWLMVYVIPFANHVLFRYLLGWAMPPKFSLLKLMRQKLLPDDINNSFVCHDYIVPLSKLPKSLEFFIKQTQIYPIWLCPTRMTFNNPKINHCSNRLTELHVDVGVYGYSPIKNYDSESTLKRMEHFCLDNQSYVALYSKTHLSYDQLVKMYQEGYDLYHSLRKQLGCETAFPHVYEKISKLGRS